MDRRKFIKSSMCLGCGAALFPTAKSNFMTEYLARFSNEKFIYKRKEDLPNSIRLEACSLCNLNCKRCWIRKYEHDIVKSDGFGYLKFENFKKLVDENPQIIKIELSNNGEIFLNPELDKIIEYAYLKNITLTATGGVNLNELSDEMAECLVVNQFKEIVVSIDGATPETYKIYRVGGDFNKVIDNIQKINKYKKKYNSEFPILVWKFILFGHNEHEIDLAREKAKELDIGIFYTQNCVPEYSPVRNIELVYKKTGINYNKSHFDTECIYCLELFEEPQFDWNGTLLGCSLNVPNHNFGVNVFEVGLMNALNSKNVVESKHMITSLSYYKIDKDFKSPCVNCLYNDFMVKENPDILEKYL